MTSRGLLDGKAVVVTGAGRGLGREFARSIAAAGAAVVVNDADEDVAERVVEEITAARGTAVAVGGSIADWSVTGRIVDECVERYGALDGFVANAGVFHWASIFDEDPESIRQIIEVNLLGSMYCGLRALTRMREQGYGSLVNVTSGSLVGIRNQSAYGATKGGLTTLTHAWALETEGTAIRVNAIAPKATTRLSGLVADRRPGEAPIPPERVAPVATYLVSDLARDITGQVVRLDGRRLSLLRPHRFAGPVAVRDTWDAASIAEAMNGELNAALAPLPHVVAPPPEA